MSVITERRTRAPSTPCLSGAPCVILVFQDDQDDHHHHLYMIIVINVIIVIIIIIMVEILPHLQTCSTHHAAVSLGGRGLQDYLE